METIDGRPRPGPTWPVTHGRPLAIVVMGVSGCGKTTVGRLLAERLGVTFIDADDLHPAENRARMVSGLPLDDAGRRPWLVAVREALIACGPRGCVVACSALRRPYRDALAAGEGRVVFLHLSLPRDVLVARVSNRRDHFMPVSLLASQLDTLEPLGPDEPGVSIDASGGPDQVVEALAGLVGAVLQHQPGTRATSGPPDRLAV